MIKSIKNFTSSNELKDISSIKGGSNDPVYPGWSPTSTRDGSPDEELITKGGTGDCGSATSSCTDQMYDC